MFREDVWRERSAAVSEVLPIALTIGDEVLVVVVVVRVVLVYCQCQQIFHKGLEEAIGSNMSPKTLLGCLLPRLSTYRRSTGRTCGAGLKMTLDMLFVRSKKDREAVEANSPLARRNWRSRAGFDVLSSTLYLWWSVIKISCSPGTQHRRRKVQVS